LRGNAERVYELDIDRNGRIEGVKRKGSIGYKIQFKYDTKTGRPIAAKIGDNKWYYPQRVTTKGAINASQCDSAGMDSESSLELTPNAIDATLIGAQTGVLFRKVYSPDEQQALEITQQDFQWFVDDLNNQLQWQLQQQLQQSIEELLTREQCINACNDITDLAWISCASFGALGLIGGPIGAAVGVAAGIGCASYFYDKRAECRQNCERRR
jgi:hypothetical protein